MMLGGAIVPDNRPASDNVPERNVVPQGPLQAGMTLEERKLLELSKRVSEQQATSAVVNTPTESAPLQMRGGWMSGDNNGAIVNPWASPEAGPEQGPSRPLTDDLRNQLASLNSGYAEQGPRPRQNFSDPGIKPDGPEDIRMDVRRESDYRQSVRNLGRIRKVGRNAAIAGGATAGLAGLDALIGGERNKREEEVVR